MITTKHHLGGCGRSRSLHISSSWSKYIHTHSAQHGMPNRWWDSKDRKEVKEQPLAQVLEDPHEDQAAYLLHICQAPQSIFCMLLVGGSVSKNPQWLNWVHSVDLFVFIFSSCPSILPQLFNRTPESPSQFDSGCLHLFQSGIVWSLKLIFIEDPCVGITEYPQ